jgi:hypothetical protein
MTSNMVALCAGCSAVLPFAGEAEIVCALPANVVVAEMMVESLGVEISSGTVLPETVVGCCGIWVEDGFDRGGGGEGGCHSERVEVELENVEGHERSVG